VAIGKGEDFVKKERDHNGPSGRKGMAEGDAACKFLMGCYIQK
jgi:hypothetical protein